MLPRESLVKASLGFRSLFLRCAMKESASASHIRLDAAQQGIDLWRNNVGVLFDVDGRPIRYGLANESAGQNKLVKSSDYIGVTPLIVTPAHIGMLLGIFTAIETKESDWTFPAPTNKKEYERCTAQAAYHAIVTKAGGYAGFARDVQDFRRIIRR